ncbi:MAG: hemagglutinin repeat-containing protein, partial [Fusobacterium sp. JB019]|nr:hemagglutinin repeat-containing protein [Fusobacterium sp. JB019]
DVGSMTVLAKKDVNLESVNMDATNTLKFMAKEGDINSTYVQDEIKTSAEQDTISVGAGVSYTAEILSLAETVKKQVDYTKNSEYSSFNDKNESATAGDKAAEIAAKTAEMGGAISKVVGGSILSGSVSVGVSSSHSEKTTESKKALDSEINAKNIIMSAEKGKVDLKGMQMEATENLGIKANEFNLEASESEYNEKESGYQWDVTVRGLASVNASKGADVGAEIGFSSATNNAYVNSKTYNNATLKGKNVNLDITNNANLKGGNIEGENVAANIGGNLNIESVQDTLEQRLHSTNVDVITGVSVDITGKVSGSAQVGATYGNIHEDKAWVKKQAGITGGNVKVDVKGNTNLKGGVIAADDGNLDFSTGSLSYEDLKDKHERDGGYAGVGATLSFGKSAKGFEKGIGGVDVKGGRVEGFHKAQTVKATIGAGNVTVGGKKLEDTGSGINRDTDNSIVTTQDKKHFKFDLDYTISPNDFRKSKDSKTLRKRNDGSDSGIDSPRNVNLKKSSTTTEVSPYKIIKTESRKTVKDIPTSKTVSTKEISTRVGTKTTTIKREVAEIGKPEIATKKNTFIKKPGTERILDPKTGKVLTDKTGKEITLGTLEKNAKIIKDQENRRWKETTVELNDGRKLAFKEKQLKVSEEAKKDVGAIIPKDGFKTDYKHAVILTENKKPIIKKEIVDMPPIYTDKKSNKQFTTKDFESKKSFNKDLGREAVDIGSHKYLVKDSNSDLKIVKVKTSFKDKQYLVDPKTKKEVTKKDLEKAPYIKEINGKGIKISKDRYFKLNDNNEITIVQKQKSYSIEGENFDKKLTSKEFKALKTNPELNGKIMKLDNGDLLVLNKNGKGYVTTRDTLERKIMKDTVDTLIKDALNKKDSTQLKKILESNKDNSLLSEQTRKDYEALYKGSNKKDFLEKVKNYDESKNSKNYIDDETGRIFDLEKDKFAETKELKEVIRKDSQDEEIRKTTYKKDKDGNYQKIYDSVPVHKKFNKEKSKETKETIEKKINKNEKLVIDKETGEVKYSEDKMIPHWNFFEGKKNWVVVKGFQKLMEKFKGKNKKEEASHEEVNNILVNEETETTHL